MWMDESEVKVKEKGDFGSVIKWVRKEEVSGSLV